MLAQLLNQDFLVDAAEDTRTQLNGLAGELERRGSVEIELPEEIGPAELRDLSEELRSAVDKLMAEGGDTKDGWICMPRDPLLSILQSELDAAVQAQAPPGAVEADPESPLDRRIAVDPGRRAADGRRAFGKFQVTNPKVLSDPGWVWSGVVIAWHKLKQKAPFGGLPAAPVEIADDARLLLMGDWGSGLERAQAVAQRMREVLDEGIAAGREQHVVHLGDVYYTGGEKEYKERFLEYWPVRDDEDIGSYTLVGNHDMYRGGHAYYGTCLADSRFSRQGGKSVFELRSPQWQLFGLDTGYEDAGLHGDQADWVRRQRADAGGKRRTALLTHHQYFSAYEDAGGKLRPALQPLIDEAPVDAWFWAHEHRCLTYEPRHGVQFSSCVGHGGIPEYLIASEGDPYPAGLRYDYRKRHGSGPEPWNTFGFAVVELAGRAMTVRYVDEHGDQHHEEVLQ